MIETPFILIDRSKSRGGSFVTHRWPTEMHHHSTPQNAGIERRWWLEAFSLVALVPEYDL